MSQANASGSTLLVTGAAGHLGKRVVELLLARGEKNVIAASRSPEKLAELEAKGAKTRRVDFDDSEDKIAASLVGVDRILIISTDAMDRPGRRREQHLRAVAGAKKAGVKHIVYTSLAHPDADSPVALAPDHRETEAALEASGVPYTALRNNLYMEVVLMGLGGALKSGTLYSAVTANGAAYVAREDCAAAAAGALVSAGTETRIFEITGPAVVTNDEVAELVTKTAGKPVKHVAVSPSDLKQGMVGAGLPGPVADLMVSFDAGISQGKLAPATSDVEKLTGNAPKAFETFLKENRAALG